MGILIIALCALAFAAIVVLAVWAKRNPNPDYVEDSDLSEREWSESIK